ncbi:NADPH-dependent FMN reductase [Streptomyces muensis]|uniref:NAD(P)H-dependent oxidoreductase n=1 Tax=Streptomyces muensis TaxID=1077944 RepID=A0A9X1PT40_STRM4|nr:NAD(P)H-dependent oxidoreductase [Streptomyces muensis]MCF1592598.1 NAD(P)H-dependent oxidoreductase [Streptomyces muensis]
MHRILVVNSSTRQGRFSDGIATWAVQRLKERGDFIVDLLDLRDHPLPFFDDTPPVYHPREYADEGVARLARQIDAADGYVFLVAEYNHGYTAVLKNALDHTFVEWRRKPVAFIGWGNVGGARAIEQLREVAVEFEMAPLRHAVHVLPDVMRAARERGGQADSALLAPLEPRLDLLADDLAWWTEALATARSAEVR